VFIFITHKPNPASRKTFFSTSRHHAGLKTAIPVIEELYRIFRMGSKDPVHGRITGVARVMDLQKALHTDLSARICERTSRAKTI